MTISATIQKRLEGVESTFKLLGCSAGLEIVNGMDKNEHGEPLNSVVLTIGDDRKYAAYSTTSAIGLSTYLQGLQHGLQLVAGGYSFKPLSASAKMKPRDSVLKTRRRKAEKAPQNSLTMARFAFQRTKYRDL
jgi:hypothetical protein